MPGAPFRSARPLICAAAVALILGITGTARAEKLEVDHRLYPPLHQAMEHPNDDTVFYDPTQPGREFDRILIAGKSAENDWTEALEFVVTRKPARLQSPAAWLAAFSPTTETACPAKTRLLAQDETSLTFAIEAAGCPGGAPLTGFYRVVFGRKTVYLVAGKFKGAMSAAQREQWLALLASARVSG